MNWTRKDWIDLALMLVGSILGIVLLFLVLKPMFGVEAGYLSAIVSGLVCAYSLRIGYRLLAKRSGPPR